MALNWQLRNCNSGLPKLKGKGHPITGHEGPGVMYSSTLSLTSALDGVVKDTLRPLYPRERDPVPIV